jgi:hypothetical protein
VEATHQDIAALFDILDEADDEVLVVYVDDAMLLDVLDNEIIDDHELMVVDFDYDELDDDENEVLDV